MQVHEAELCDCLCNADGFVLLEKNLDTNRLCGGGSVRLCGCVGVWLCGCAAVWVCGCVAVGMSVCLCGCVNSMKHKYLLV